MLSTPQPSTSPATASTAAASACAPTATASTASRSCTAARALPAPTASCAHALAARLTPIAGGPGFAAAAHTLERAGLTPSSAASLATAELLATTASLPSAPSLPATELLAATASLASAASLPATELLAATAARLWARTALATPAAEVLPTLVRAATELLAGLDGSVVGRSVEFLLRPLVAVLDA